MSIIVVVLIVNLISIAKVKNVTIQTIRFLLLQKSSIVILQTFQQWWSIAFQSVRKWILELVFVPPTLIRPALPSQMMNVMMTSLRMALLPFVLGSTRTLNGSGLYVTRTSHKWDYFVWSEEIRLTRVGLYYVMHFVFPNESRIQEP